jgi:hypothetical protein
VERQQHKASLPQDALSGHSCVRASARAHRQVTLEQASKYRRELSCLCQQFRQTGGAEGEDPGAKKKFDQQLQKQNIGRLARQEQVTEGGNHR